MYPGYLEYCFWKASTSQTTNDMDWEIAFVLFKVILWVMHYIRCWWESIKPTGSLTKQLANTLCRTVNHCGQMCEQAESAIDTILDHTQTQHINTFLCRVNVSKVCVLGTFLCAFLSHSLFRSLSDLWSPSVSETVICHSNKSSLKQILSTVSYFWMKQHVDQWANVY